jgi:hypothetical protein
VTLRKDELLFKIKDKVAVFLTEGFTACSQQQIGSKVRMCDLATILLKILQPWKSKSSFFEAMEALD